MEPPPIVILGGGPAGSSTAIRLARRGFRSVLVEKAAFPRYHVGESLTGEAGQALRELGLEDRMRACGHPVKRGVRVYGPGGRNSFWVPVRGFRPGEGLFDSSTWSVPRDEFDRMLLDGAVDAGVEVLRAEAVEPIVEGRRVRGLRVRGGDGAFRDLPARLLVDCSGLGTFLAHHGVTGPKRRGRYDKQVAIFSQVTDAVRDPGDASGNTLIFYRQPHHWAWFIPLDDRRTSVGVVVPTEHYAGCGEDHRAFLLRELRELNAELSRRLPRLELVEDVRGISSYSYDVEDFAGPGFLCVGDAHRFTDPIFSFGVFFAMKEAELAVDAIARILAGEDEEPVLREYLERCTRGQDNVQELIDFFWQHPYGFSVFAHRRYPDDIVGLFAGRVYDEEPSPGLRAIRALNAGSRSEAAAG